MSILRVISSLPFRSTASASLAVLLFSFSTTAVAADEKPANAAELFDYTRLWDVRIHISEDSFRGLEPKQARGFDRDFPYVEATVEIAGHPSLKVALRYKGNSSYSSARDTKKKSFKVDFNRIIEKQKFLGLTKLNLNNNILDPSQVRETLAYRMFNNLGLPSCRTAFAKVYLEIEGRSGEEYLGLYTMVEQVNGSFLQERFGTRDGLLLKPERSNSFPHLGDEWSDYERVYVPKTEAEAVFARRLIEFTRFVEESEDKEFAEKIFDYVDIPELMKFTALHAVLAHLDSFLLRGHNFYIYLPRSDGRFHWLPWDVNSTFAGHRSAGSAAQQTDLSIAHPYIESVKLISRIMKIQSARAEYDKQVKAILAGPFKSETITGEMNKLRGVISAAVSKDSNTDFKRFVANFTGTGGGKETGQPKPPTRQREPGRGGMQQKPLLADFIAARTSAILSQLSEGREGYVPRSSRRGSRGDRGAGPGQNTRRPSRGPFPRRPVPGN